MTESHATLDEAAVFRDTLQQTIAEGIAQMTGKKGFPAAYRTFLETARPHLLEARDADFGAHNHDFIAESLAVAADGMGKPLPGGAWQARIFLAGFSEGVCNMVHRLSKGPLPDGPVSPMLILDEVRDHASFVGGHFADDKTYEGQAHRLLASKLAEAERQSRSYLQESRLEANPSDVRVAFYEHLAREVHVLLKRRKGNRWLAACESAHLRLRSYLAGSTTVLEFVHPTTAREAAWAHPVKAGRISQAAAEECWWFRPAVGRLAELRTRTYWRQGHLDGFEDAVAVAITAARLHAEDPSAAQHELAVAEAGPDLSQRLRAWICGAIAGGRLARELPPGPVEQTWPAALKQAWPTDLPDLDPLLADIDVSGVGAGHCGHGRAHALEEELLRRLAGALACDAVLPEAPKAAFAFGLVYGHHRSSLHGVHAHEEEHQSRPPLK